MINLMRTIIRCNEYIIKHPKPNHKTVYAPVKYIDKKVALIPFDDEDLMIKEDKEEFVLSLKTNHIFESIVKPKNGTGLLYLPSPCRGKNVLIIPF